MNEKFKLAFLIFASICTGIDIAKEGEWILALCCILYPLYYLFKED